MKQINVQKIEKQKQILIEKDIVANITQELNRLIEFKTQLISEYNIQEIKDELLKASSIIEDVHVMQVSNLKNFNRLQFEYTTLYLKIQKYEIEQEIKILNELSNKISEDTITLEKKLKNLKLNQKKIEEKHEKAEERNNNLIYNLLGFLTAFSIVSAVVGVVTEIDGVINIMLFMTFTILILLTTLIGLHNFYENSNKRETKLQDNYFLWKLLLVISIIMAISLGIQYASENKENIIQYIDRKIEEVIDKKVENEIKKGWSKSTT